MNSLMVNLLSLSGRTGSGTTRTPILWILTNSIWEDDNIWIDTEHWRDS